MLNTLLLKDKIINKNRPADDHDRVLLNYFHTPEPAVIKTIHFPERRKRTRLVVKKGIENVSIPLENIVFFYTENKIVFAIDHSGKKYVANGSLATLQPELDSNIFFRANRQYIVNISYVKSFRTYEKVKLRVEMNAVDLGDQHFIIISQETAPAFRKWIYAA